MQTSIFDLNPTQHIDLVTRIADYHSRIKALKPLFFGKDKSLSARQLKKINDLLAGIEETMRTGKGLNEMVDESDLNRFLLSMTKKAKNMRTQAQADAMTKSIQEAVEQKERQFRMTGNLSQPFLKLADIPGVDINKAVLAVKTAGIDFTPAIELAEIQRLEINSHDVFDTSQSYKLLSTKTSSLGVISGGIAAFAKAAYSLLRDDKRADAGWRDSRIIKNGIDLKLNYTIFSPDNIAATREKFQKKR